MFQNQQLADYKTEFFHWCFLRKWQFWAKDAVKMFSLKIVADQIWKKVVQKTSEIPK